MLGGILVILIKDNSSYVFKQRIFLMCLNNEYCIGVAYPTQCQPGCGWLRDNARGSRRMDRFPTPGGSDELKIRERDWEH
jgi:hypothetical protein